MQYGSQGEQVKKLQKELNKYGYKLDVDGQFGTKTQAAVRDYQKNNGLSVDGIVGKNTWGKLNSTPEIKKEKATTSTGVKKTSKPTQEKRPEYKKSSAVKNAEKKLQKWEKGSPEKYSSAYAEEIDAILGEILGREDFKYSLNADPLYEQYRELYVENGKKAMEDTVGKAAALTGGYGSSYAVTAGEQAYDEYLRNLNDVGLKLRDRAYEQYEDEGDKLFRDVSLLRSLDGDDYNKYLDELSRYYKDGEYLLERLGSMSDAEYEQFLQSVDAWESDRDYELELYRDRLDREEFEKEMAFKEKEAQRDQQNADRSYNLALQKASSSSSGSDTKKKSDKDDEPITYPMSYKEFYARTGYSGILTETEYDRSTPTKKKYSTYKKYLQAMYKKYKDYRKGDKQ